MSKAPKPVKKSSKASQAATEVVLPVILPLTEDFVFRGSFGTEEGEGIYGHSPGDHDLHSGPQAVHRFGEISP